MTTTLPDPRTPPPGPPSSEPPSSGPPSSGTTAVPRGPFTPDRPRASWWARVVAVLLDSAIVATVAWFATGAAPSYVMLPTWGAVDPPIGPGTTAWVGWTMLALGVLQAYTGTTPGKRVAGIAVVDAGSGRPIGLLGTVLRFLAHLLDAILMIGYLRAAWHPEGRTFADSLLGTVVVRTDRPRPHPWVARTRRARDARAPWLRWPPLVTYTAALVLCAACAAASLVQGGGIDRHEATGSSCSSDGPYVATAVVGSEVVSEWESRLGIRGPSEHRWRVAAGWSTGLGLDTSDNPDAEIAEATLTVRSGDGRTYSSASDAIDSGAGGGDVSPLWWSMADQVAATALETPQDVSGWEATVMLLDTQGTVIAECATPVPAVAP